jgi:hypothetical protein
MRSFQTTVVCSLVFAVAAVQGAGRRDENKKQMILNGQIHMKGQSAWPICEACVPKELIEAPGIGFDLNTGYAYGAIFVPLAARQLLYHGSIQTLTGFLLGLLLSNTTMAQLSMSAMSVHPNL